MARSNHHHRRVYGYVDSKGRSPYGIKPPSVAEMGIAMVESCSVAVMAALVGQELFMTDGKLSLFGNVDIVAGAFTFWIATKTRSLLWTVIAGAASAMVLRLLSS